MQSSFPRHSLPFHRRPLASPLAPPRPIRAQAGFTLVELLVSMVVFVTVLVAVMAIFTSSSRLARLQIHTADMQQSLRIGQYEIVRYLRMAGRGGLPARQFPSAVPAYVGQLLPNGVSIAVESNVADGTRIGDCDCAQVLPGTDVVTIRGVFSSPIYQINPAAGEFSVDANGGSLTLRNLSPTGVPQSLQAVKDALDEGDLEALLLVSPLTDELYAIVEIVDGSYSPADNPETATLNFTFSGANSVEYFKLMRGGQFPAEMSTVAYAGILEEYRYYIREQRAVPLDDTSELIPRLSRARLYPGTEVAHRNNNTNLTSDLADNIIDLQVSLGIDTDFDNIVSEGAPPSADDEWLFNHPDDDPNDNRWNNNLTQPAKLYFLRINTLAQTDRPDPRFQAEPLTLIEDKDYASDYPEFNQNFQRMFRRRLLRTSVDLRNLS